MAVDLEEAKLVSAPLLTSHLRFMTSINMQTTEELTNRNPYRTLPVSNLNIQ